MSRGAIRFGIRGAVRDMDHRLAVPRKACDAHIHIHDSRFLPSEAGAPILPSATTADYRRLQQRLGVERAVVVTPAVYRTDNRVTLDAIAALGADRARGVAVLHPDVGDATLDALHVGGIRGIRFTLFMAPHRMVWGSDWPHPTETSGKPDDAVLLDLLLQWVPDAGQRQRILVENPAELYGFPP